MYNPYTSLFIVVLITGCAQTIVRTKMLARLLDYCYNKCFNVSSINVVRTCSNVLIHVRTLLFVHVRTSVVPIAFA